MQLLREACSIAELMNSKEPTSINTYSNVTQINSHKNIYMNDTYSKR